MDPAYERNQRFHEICCLGDVDLARKFVHEHKPDINARNKVNGWTALHWAAKRNQESVVRYLLELGAVAEAQNNDAKCAAFYTKSEAIKRMLGYNAADVGTTHEPAAVATKEETSSFVPNYLLNPVFYYADSTLYSSSSSSSSSSSNGTTATTTTTTPLTKRSNEMAASNHPTDSQSLNSGLSLPTKSTSSSPAHSKAVAAVEVITVRVRATGDEDFVEFDIDKLNTSFDTFKAICKKELEHVEPRANIVKVRKLPNILIRKTDDIRRLKNEQDIEIVLA